MVIGIVIALATPKSGADQPRSLPATAAPACPSAHKAVRFYSRRLDEWRDKMGVGHTTQRSGGRSTGPRPGTSGHSCPRYLAHVLQRKAHAARVKTVRWLEVRQRRLRWDPMVAINVVFGPYAPQAHRVASCESGHDPTAVNGQYLGMFQMGSYARSKYGHGSDPLTQARAAYHYFVDSGRDWSPWSCKP